jgi:hypothetical protein
MKNKLGLAAILLWVVTIGTFGYFFVRGWTKRKQRSANRDSFGAGGARSGAERDAPDAPLRA